MKVVESVLSLSLMSFSVTSSNSCGVVGISQSTLSLGAETVISAAVPVPVAAP